MLVRIASALILIPGVLALLFFAPPRVLLLTIGIVGTLSLREYFHLIKKIGLRGQPWFGYLAFWSILVGLQEKYLPAAAIFAAVVLACFITAMWRLDPMRERAIGMMADLFGVLYLALCLYPVVPLRYDFGEKTGLRWILLMLAVIWVGDTSALLAGRSFGRTLFAPGLSPKKTNEGAIAGLLSGVAAAVLLQRLFFVELPLYHVIMLSLLMGMAGQLGDLGESLLKRAADVKDSSSLLPGHGGMLDRIDSLLFAIPVLYIYLLRLYAT
jgi:phosphatidate cytidylyltransferase